MGMRRAQDVTPELACHVDVGDEPALPQQETRVLQPKNGPADHMANYLFSRVHPVLPDKLRPTRRRNP